MDPTTVAALATLFALRAALYSNVGRGGASANIAAMFTWRTMSRWSSLPAVRDGASAAESR
jgi:hypothetical protein